MTIERYTFHALPLILNTKKHWFSRLFWLILLLISFSFYIYYLRLIFIKFKLKPEISVIHQSLSTSELPFPAITICPSFYKLQNDLNSDFDELSKDQKIVVAVNSQWCSPQESLENLKNLNFDNDLDVVKIMRESQPELSEIFVNCTRNSLSIDCSEIFTRVLTENGFCFTYNMLNYDEIFTSEISSDFDGYKRIKGGKESQWTLDGGYKVDSGEVQPRKATKSEEIQVFVNVRKNIDLISLKRVNF